MNEMKILLHACCGPCACYPTEKLTADGIDFDIFWYNPNVHPYKEFKKRLATLRDFCTKGNYSLLIDKSYPIEDTIKAMLNEPECRCRACYRVRLRRIAKYAAEHGYDAFSTTLLVSPYQKHNFIKEIAVQTAEEFGIKFYYEDWRVGYQRGVERSLQMGLYRQQYCGCVFSERDRYEVQGKVTSSCLPVRGGGGEADGGLFQQELIRVTKNIAIVK